MEQDPIQSMVEKFSQTMVPVDWLNFDISQRVSFLEGYMPYDGELMRLPYLSPQNIHYELLRLPIGSLKRIDSNRYVRCIKVIKNMRITRIRDKNYGFPKVYREISY